MIQDNDLNAADSDMTMNRKEDVPRPAQVSRNGIYSTGSLN